MATIPSALRWHDDYQRRAGLDRARFLDGRSPAATPSEIIDSWRRSLRRNVDPSRIASDRATPGDPESEVLRCVDTVLRTELTHLSGETVSLVFADPSGRILLRHCPDRGLTARLDSVHLSPGASYEEGTVGTNGIGTTVATTRPSLVVGGEHFNERLSVFACAGAPVLHPVNGTLVGVVDLTCVARDGSPSLTRTVARIADRIQRELLAGVARPELTLLRDYLAACHHATGPILAVNDDMVMMNRHAQQQLGAGDRAALLSCTADASDDPSPRTLVADLPSGLVARLDYRPSVLTSSVIGGVFRVHLDDVARSPGPAPARPLASLPGVVGTSASWRRVCTQVRGDGTSRRRVVLEGEPGVGKTALIRAVHEALRPAAHLRIVDLAAVDDLEAVLDDLETELTARQGTLLLRHLERVPEEMVGPLAELLVEYAAGDSLDSDHWVVATKDTTVSRSPVDSALIPCFDRSVLVPPLRHRTEDIAAIADLTLRRASRGREIRYSPGAIRSLTRMQLPGNGRELASIARQVLRTTRSGVVEEHVLPPQCHSAVRRMLTPLESLERDAIVQALHDHDGRKNAAAEHLGMSRATIYRKIRDYGITWRPPSS